MGNSLQDQLMKAGLANRKQAVKAKKAKNNKEKLKRAGVEVTDEAAQLAEQAARDKVERDRELNKQQLEASQKHAIAAQIKQLVEVNRITSEGEQDFKFSDGALVRIIQVSERQRKAIVSGVLAVVRDGDNNALVPRKVALKIAEREDSCVLVCNDDSGDEQFDDEYADYQIPDDLMW